MRVQDKQDIRKASLAVLRYFKSLLYLVGAAIALFVIAFLPFNKVFERRVRELVFYFRGGVRRV